MKALVSTLLLAFITASAFAEEALMDGGRSPDGRYEVRITREISTDPNNSQDSYFIHLYAANSANPFYSFASIGGYDRYETATKQCRAFWHQSGEFVVITDDGTRHSKEIYIIAVSKQHTEELKFPDYIQNALGRIGATEIDLDCASIPKRWDGDDLFLTLYFAARPPTGGRHFYTSDVTLHLNHGPNSAPTVALKSVTAPKDQDG